MPGAPNGRGSTETEWLDILDAHAVALNEHEDNAHFEPALWLLQQSVTASDLLILLQLAQSLKLALRPVKPRTQFRADLRQQLAQQTSLKTLARRSLKRLIWPAAAILGSLLSIIVILRHWRGMSMRPRAMQSAV